MTQFCYLDQLCQFDELLQGVYNVKFTVDGEWRTAPGWEEVSNADGTTNNILTVD